jgi:mono/diheme cytochrome c family protein
VIGVVALSGIAIIGLAAAAAIGLAFVGGLIWLSLRGRPERKPDIPPAMRPGPADETLERAKVVSLPGWGTLFVLFFSLWIPITWFNEPTVNVNDEVEAVERSIERGSRWFQVSSEENPTGFGCARCHGANAEGGSVSFTNPEGEVIPDYPVPKLVDVCGGPNTGHPLIKSLEDVRNTIMQGRQPNTPMPSWSIRFQGAMNDQQIQDLINYLISIQDVPFENNVCTNDKAAAAAATPAPTPSTP